MPFPPGYKVAGRIRRPVSQPPAHHSVKQTLLGGLHRTARPVGTPLREIAATAECSRDYSRTIRHYAELMRSIATSLLLHAVADQHLPECRV